MSTAAIQPPRPCLVAVAEHAQGRLSPPTLELAASARALAGLLDLEPCLALLDHEPLALASQAARTCGLPVWAVRVPGLTQFHGEAQGRVLAGLLPARGVQVVLASHTSGALDWLPGLAARLGGACLTGVEGFRMEGPDLVLTRPALFGKALEEMRPLAWPLALTLQPGAMAAPPPPEPSEAEVELIEVADPGCASRVLASSGQPAQDQALAGASVVVAGGRGLGKAENLELLRGLAGLFSSAALAGSRPICDLGWLGYASQVGQTGATVSPRLYIACGISGARQHTLGMQGSGFIVAINQDPGAAIFNLADVCVVEDLARFIPALLEAHQNQG